MADERITVSRETLRAELAEMELRLTRWVASADSVKQLEGRVANLEASRLSREHLAHDFDELETAVRTLETDRIGRSAVRRFAWGTIAAVVAVNAIAATVLAYFF